MDQDTPKKKDSRAGKLRFPLEGRKKKVTSAEQQIKVLFKEIKEGSEGEKKKKKEYQHTSDRPFLVKNRPRCLALPPKNFPSSLIQVRHKGTPNRP